jgi:XRE family transcriptional regulator, regulator of sulfur utilization
MNLGSTISQLREKKRLKQGQLADELDITQTYLSQIENNKKLPNIALLERISEKLSTPLPFIFFLALDEKDIPEGKVDHFRFLEPLLKKYIGELISESND